MTNLQRDQVFELLNLWQELQRRGGAKAAFRFQRVLNKRIDRTLVRANYKLTPPGIPGDINASRVATRPPATLPRRSRQDRVSEAPPSPTPSQRSVILSEDEFDHDAGDGDHDPLEALDFDLRGIGLVDQQSGYETQVALRGRGHKRRVEEVEDEDEGNAAEETEVREEEEEWSASEAADEEEDGNAGQQDADQNADQQVAEQDAEEYEAEEADGEEGEREEPIYGVGRRRGRQNYRALLRLGSNSPQRTRQPAKGKGKALETTAPTKRQQAVSKQTGKPETSQKRVRR